MEKQIGSFSHRMEVNLKRSYVEAEKDPAFKKLVNHIGAKENVAMKYTSQLEDTVKELNNCSNCPNLICCKNKIEGHVFYPTVKDDRITFSYTPCKYKKDFDLKAQQKLENGSKTARMADIDITDKKRVKVIKWIKKFYDDFGRKEKCKGLYLHGNFGCGKTYLLTALFNELSKKRITTEIVYFPELLREIKGNFDIMEDRIDYLKNVDLLLIDDIGAEKVSEWGRDEILGTILQYRMDKEKSTFFTSNLTIEELEAHLSLSNGKDDNVKARRIIERIKQLTEDMELISENRRK